MTLLDKETSLLREETLPGGGSLSFILKRAQILA